MSDYISQQEFYEAAIARLAESDELALRIKAGDPFAIQNIKALAYMFQMLSWQMAVASVEPWTKARDNMVLADATAKGVLPYAKPPKHRISVVNGGTESNTIQTGRRILDANGRIWVVVDGCIVLPGEQGYITAEQRESKVVKHQVTESTSFYKIEVPQLDVDQYLIGLELTRSDDNQKFSFFERYHNVNPGDFSYHIITDETEVLYIEFGISDIAGYTPAIGENYDITLHYTYGVTILANASPFSFEYTSSASDPVTELYAESSIFKGANPMTIQEMRELCGFPSSYDSNAVFLNNFHFLFMRQHSPFVFLSVWNEQLEEQVRGASVNNINRLFVSFVKEDVTEAEMRRRITETLQDADNSYWIKFVDTVEKQISATCTFRLSPVHDAASVMSRARTLILDQYGRKSVWARRGRARINCLATTNLLKEAIPELQDNVSDVFFTVTEEEGLVKPEEFRYIADQSLAINNTPLILF